MEFYLVGLWLTGALLMAIPWDSIPICLPLIYLQTVAGKTATTSCILNSDLVQWIGAGTIMCTLPLISSNKRKIMAGALITAGLLALAIIFIYLIRPGNCRHAILPCRVKTIPIILSVGVVQLLLAVRAQKNHATRNIDRCLTSNRILPVKPEVRCLQAPQKVFLATGKHLSLNSAFAA